MIIAGDIGGTKSHLVAYVEEHGKLSAVARKRYVTRDFSSFEKLVEEFSGHAFASAQNKTVEAAGFGVPGTVVDGRLHAAHIPWALDSASLAASLEIPPDRSFLSNNLVATALELHHLHSQHFDHL